MSDSFAQVRPKLFHRPSLLKSSPPAALPQSSAPSLPKPNLFLMVGFYALVLFLFFYLSRVADFGLHALKVTMITNVVFFGTAMLSGGFLGALKSRPSILMVVFVAWLFICLPFSVWPGGSVETVKIASRSLALMVSIIALAATTQWCLRLMYTIGFAMATAGSLSTLLGEQSHTGRLALTTGTFADPNFYAMALLLGLPFLLLRASNEPNIFKRGIPLAAVLPVLYATVATGSRAGMLALCVLFCVYFWRSPAWKRAVLVASAVAGVALASAFFSDYLLGRYTVMFETESTPENAEEAANMEIAASSTAARKYLFMRSVELTLLNPLFGVGPGMFPVAENDHAKELGARKGAWHETHNTYTQVASETGLPGFALYLGALFMAFRVVTKLSQIKPLTPDPQWERVRQGAIYLQMSFVVVVIGATFLSIAYTGLLFMLVGLVVALERTAHREFPHILQPVRPAAPVSAPVKKPAAALVPSLVSRSK